MTSKAKKIFESDSNSDAEDFSFSTNSKFAKSYDKSQQKELLKKLKKRDLESESSSSDSEESEENEGFADEEFDKKFFCTLASIKAKDPKIYENDVEFFGEVDLSTRKRSKEDKPITIRDLERKVILEHGGMFEDVNNKKSELPELTEEEKKDKKMFQLSDDSDGEEAGDGVLFKMKKEDPGKKKTVEEINDDIVKPMKPHWNDPNISKDDAYLRDYVLNRHYRDDGEGDDEGNLTDDEVDLEKQAEFEQKVNFRFEEPDQDYIKRFPRTIATSVRNVDDKRKKKRAEVKERKTREKEERKREIEKLKELKKQEIEEKISKLKQVAGSENILFNDADLSDDFDPEEHDRKMQEMFNNEYYGIDEGEDKPECPDIEDLKVQDWDNYDPAEEEDNDTGAHCDDEDFNMDCEYDPKEAKKEFEKEMIESTQSRKRKKRRSKFAEVLRKDKPVFNPEDEKTYAEYIDEYYKLDCEDVIGDVKCRFKYVETVPNDFGLTVEEILMAKNKELNKWASLKKAVQIRPKHVEINEAQQYDRRRQNWFLKKQILRSVYGEESDEEEVNQKNLSSNKTEKKVEETKGRDNTADNPVINDDSSKQKKKKKNVPATATVVKVLDTSEEKVSEIAEDDPKTLVDNQESISTSKSSKKKKITEILEVKSLPVETETSQVVKKVKKEKKQQESHQKANKQDQNLVSSRTKKRKAEDNKQSSVNPSKKFKFGNKSGQKVNQDRKKPKSEIIDYETTQGKFAIHTNRLMAFGINPKKFRGKVKYGTSDKGKGQNTQGTSKAQKKKKNKKKHQKQVN